MGERIEVDLAVVGAGPAGLYATYYAGFRGMSVAVIDSLPEPGGQISALYPEKSIFDIAGLPAIRGQELVDALVTQAATAKPTFLLGQSAEELTAAEDHVLIGTDTGTQVRAAAVLLTAGIGTFTPRELPVGSEYLGRGLRYFVPRLDELAGQEVVVVGGGDSAVDWALALEPYARSVTLVHRRAQFRAHERSVADLHASGVRVLTPYEVSAVDGEAGVSSVTVSEIRGPGREVLPAQAVVAALGFIADLSAMERWGLEMRRRYVAVDRSMRTNLPRIFAAGDITDYEGKVRLISVGFGEAAAAVNNLAPLVNPALSTVPGHSSDAL
ncbi:NAD(P)/FAD-dependent oxidoreductase [Micromonospora endophytica]|uniref:Ferredoxin--NADP reductase n=1 Tax=Micromonospora endophytica TaxID=515350 RepID=A0A2W2BVN9_9ACTN|nr:NAD(P)/FAD-dependent oxidoreductase [Micromonospora endophytica]PZF89620.1 ferredoxin--NADP(+) reductase [Micromonospora endophytica]RIW43860.1 NAD(P)/FAD-dependent oxidoreductase [Micromonospora endophytica]BCJ56968.1 ferredoxin--NADP reductase [Micromonospora endophytica]